MSNAILFHHNLISDIHELQLEICKKINVCTSPKTVCIPNFPFYIALEESDGGMNITGLNLSAIHLEKKYIYIETILEKQNEKVQKKLILAELFDKISECSDCNFEQIKLIVTTDKKIKTLAEKVLKPVRVFKSAEVTFDEHLNGKTWRILNEKWIKIKKG